MGLSTSEKEGCRQILFQLNSSDLLSLCETVIKTKTSVRDRAELIKKIIEESKTAEELLHRKKVYRDIIYQYLNNQKIFLYAKSTKEMTIEKAIEHWRKSDIPIKGEWKDEASGTAVDQLSIQISGLSIQNSQEYSKVDKAELLVKGNSQTTDGNAFALFHISTPGAKPKVNPPSKKSLSTTVSFNVSVTSVLKQNSNDVSHATKGPRKKKQ